MAQLGNNVFSPGTILSDANEANLLAGSTLNAAGTTNGTAVQVDRPGDVAVVLETSTVTGTTPTISITVQGSDDVTFASGVVELGTLRLQSGTAASQSSVRKAIQPYVHKKYMRAVVTVAGTSPVYTGSTLKVKQEHYFETASTSAAV